MRKFRIVFTDILVSSLLIFSGIQFNLVVYGIGQARGQLHIVWNSASIQTLKEKHRFTDKESDKIDLIVNLKKFSVDSLDYLPSDNYSTYFDQKGKSLLWIVTACKPYEMSDYKWTFPYLGEVSYKGYFDSLKAVRERNRLIIEGWDTDISRINAWSTLGFFKDPVFSEMLKKHKGQLAELIFHELFHGTIYAKSSVDMNENLANFISRKATLQFLKSDTLLLNEYKLDLAEEKAYDEYILNCAVRLDSLYLNMKVRKLPATKCLTEKMKLILSFCMELDKKVNLNKERTARLKKRFISSGNAYFMHFKRYDAYADSLENVLQNQYKGNLRKMIVGLKSEIKSL